MDIERITYTTKEVAEIMGISVLEARKIIKSYNFPKIIIGPRTNIILKDAFLNWLKNKDSEKWKPLIYGNLDLSNRYEISSFGKIRRIDDKKELKLHKNKQGYMTICISLGKRKRKLLKIHRAVAYAFISNPCNFPVVNHLDGDKTNNNMVNLEWCTFQNNVNHAIRTGLFRPGTYKKKTIKSDN